MKRFRKKGPEVIDLTELQKKGILERSKAIEQQNRITLGNEDKIVDLSNNSNSSDSGAFGFLSSLANAGGVGGSNDSNLISASHDLRGLKNKIEDIEYKLEKFIERLNKIEEKLGDVN